MPDPVKGQPLPDQTSRRVPRLEDLPVWARLEIRGLRDENEALKVFRREAFDLLAEAAYRSMSHGEGKEWMRRYQELGAPSQTTKEASDA